MCAIQCLKHTYRIQAALFIRVSALGAFEEHCVPNLQVRQVLRHFALWIHFDDKLDMAWRVVIGGGSVWPEEVLPICTLCFEGDVLPYWEPQDCFLCRQPKPAVVVWLQARLLRIYTERVAAVEPEDLCVPE